MKVLAIDPGSEQSAYVIWDGEKIIDFDILDNDTLLDYLVSASKIPTPEAILVIEKVVSYGMPVGKTVFETVYWTGRFCQAWQGNHHHIPRLRVKQHICHDSRAKDSNIRQALVDRFGKPGTKKAQGLTYGLKKDLWQAFALAVYFYDTNT